MKRITVFLLLIGLAAVSVCAEPVVHYSTKSRQGGIFWVRLYGDVSTYGLEVTLLDREGGKVGSVPSFSYVPQGFVDNVWVAFMGVPSYQLPGEYVLHIAVSDSEYPSDLYVDVRIDPYQFISEEIPLTSSLTGLRREPEPRKEREALLLQSLLKTYTKSAVFSREKHMEPVEGYRMTSFFGDRRTYRYSDGTEARSIHNGIDMAREIGTPVYASGSGRVIFAGDWLIAGNTVLIEHLPGVIGLYYHLDSLSVKEGDYVARGTQIGTLGMTGLATGPHLHWEVRVCGVAIDPFLLIEGNLVDKQVSIGNIMRAREISQNNRESKGGDENSLR